MKKPEVVWKATGRPLGDGSKASETLRYFYAQNLDSLSPFWAEAGLGQAKVPIRGRSPILDQLQRFNFVSGVGIDMGLVLGSANPSKSHFM